MALFFWTGEADFLIQEKRYQWMAAFEKKHGGDMNVSVVDGQAVTPGELIAELETMPFLAEKRLIFVQGLPPRTTDKFDSKKAEVILEGLKDIPETNVVVFVQSQPDKRTGFYKKLSKLADTEVFKGIKDFELDEWVKKQVAKRGGEILPTAVSHLTEIAGTDLWKIDNEIAKLVAYTNKEKAISENDIDRLVVPVVPANVFSFLDAVSERKKTKALKELHAIMDEGESLMQLFALLVRQIRNLIIAKSEPGITKDVLIKECKLHPFVAQKTIGFAKKFSFDELKSLYQTFLDIDRRIKTGGITIAVGNERALALEIEKIVLTLS